MDDKKLEQVKALVNDIKKQGYNSVCFSLPCYNVGGGPHYLCNLAIALSKYTDLKVYYADYKGGYPTRLLEGSNVEIVEYKDDDLVFPIQEPTIIFTNTTRIIQIKKMNPLSKVLVWHWETIPCGWPILLFNGEARRYIKTARKNNALIYHDWSARDVLSNQFKISLNNLDYLELYSDSKPLKERKNFRNENETNVVWLSRLSNDKIYSLINIIDNFAKLKTNKVKRLHIIGDGLGRSIVENHAKQYESEIEFIFKGTIPHDKLDSYLVDNADVVFAMGMSVTESASLKIPSVFVQLSTKKFDDDAYYWLYNTKEYCVGITTEEKKRFDVKSSTLKEILDLVSSEEGQKEAGEKCYEYALKHFTDFDNIIIKFLTYLRNSSLTYKKVKKVCKYTPYSCVEQIDYKLKHIILCRRTKFGDRLRYYILGIPVKNVKLDNNLKYSKWGLFSLPPIFRCLRKKQYVEVDNKTSSERKIRIFKKTFIKISKTRNIKKYRLFGRLTFLVKRYNVGYKYPASQLKD